jgi:hypothetical protein
MKLSFLVDNSCYQRTMCDTSGQPWPAGILQVIDFAWKRWGWRDAGLTKPYAAAAWPQRRHAKICNKKLQNFTIQRKNLRSATVPKDNSDTVRIPLQ